MQAQLALRRPSRVSVCTRSTYSYPDRLASRVSRQSRRAQLPAPVRVETYGLQTRAEDGSDDDYADPPPQPISPMFTRPRALKLLQRVMAETPDQVVVLDGPANAGKTELLKEAMRVADKHQPFLHLNLRLGESRTPAGLATMLAEELRRQPGFIKQMRDLLDKVSMSDLKLGLEYAASGLKVTAGTDRGAESPPLSVMLKLFQEWLADFRDKGCPPVLIIDEASILTQWSRDDELSTLLRFFVSITKEQHLCHVFLATSDDFLNFWLTERGLRKDQWWRMTLCDLTREEAEKFLFGDPGRNWDGYVAMRARHPDFVLPPTLLGEVHELCGGNIGAMRSIVSQAALLYGLEEGDTLEACWNKAFRYARNNAIVAVNDAFTPPSIPPKAGYPAAWTPTQWATMLDAIANAQGHTVNVKSVASQFGNGDVSAGTLVVESMVRHNMLALRGYADNSEELVFSSFVDGKKVVTAPNAAVLAAIVKREWEES